MHSYDRQTKEYQKAYDVGDGGEHNPGCQCGVDFQAF